ncbi:metallophosphoesterase family protein [Kitasatospora mediocidica]|uniref:metallophosphoesterase family protein n=1 Tax=Kitasatospora mediocidica TaxID=58352 RepID=UPI0005669023|nr:metallophosphoesterase [Kitasatospora mediocidica]
MSPTPPDQTGPTGRTDPTTRSAPSGGRLLAVSDLHIGMSENRAILESLRPGSDEDWLLVAGDVGEMTEDIEWALRLLKDRFSTVVWAPGNHELWTPREDRVQLRGVARYRHLVELCRGLGVLTPEDPYPVWTGPGGPVAVAPLFVLYDYSFRAPGTDTVAQSLAYAHETGVVCSDEYLLHPDPYPDRGAWCRARVAETERRLAAHDPAVPLVLVNHYPLVREPTRVLHYPEFAQWCGTELTADWHQRFTTAAVVYGHLHIPRTTWYDGVRFEEVSIGYPREWRRRGHPKGLLRQILPYPAQPATAPNGAATTAGQGTSTR